jgi:hypothetical protein
VALAEGLGPGSVPAGEAAETAPPGGGEVDVDVVVAVAAVPAAVFLKPATELEELTNDRYDLLSIR